MYPDLEHTDFIEMGIQLMPGAEPLYAKPYVLCSLELETMR